MAIILSNIKIFYRMKEIKIISLERFNNGAHYLFMQNILSQAMLDEKLSVHEKTAPLITALKDALSKEDEKLKISQKSFWTDAIAESDSKRGVLYMNYKRAVKSFLNFPNSNLAEAAKVLWQHIKDFGITPQMQLDKETGLLINFIGDLQTKYAEQVEALSLTAFVEKLDMENSHVITATTKRTEERMGVVTGALKTARAATDTAYRELRRMVNALATVEGETDYVSFIDYVNVEITHYKQEVINGRNQTTGEKTPAETA